MKQVNISLLALSLSVCSVMSASAQIGKGVKFIGGRMGIDRSHSIADQLPGTLEDTRFNLSVSPNAGIYISDAWALGLSIDYGYRWEESKMKAPLMTHTKTNTNNSLGFGVFARYAKPVGKKFFLFADFSVSAAIGKFKAAETRVDSLGTLQFNGERTAAFGDNIAALVRPGVIYFINPQFGLETSYGGLAYNYTKAGNIKSSNIGLNMGLSSLSFGANYYFRCKPKPRPVTEVEE